MLQVRIIIKLLLNFNYIDFNISKLQSPLNTSFKKPGMRSPPGEPMGTARKYVANVMERELFRTTFMKNKDYDPSTQGQNGNAPPSSYRRNEL